MTINSAASFALASLGVDIDELRGKLRAAQVTGTSDEQPEQAGRRQMAIQVTDEILTLVLTDPVIVEAGKEALLASSDEGVRLQALRFGSSGERVLELQDKLLARPEGAGVTRTGVFDWKTLGGVLRWQKENKLSPSGIIAAEAAAKLALHWS